MQPLYLKMEGFETYCKKVEIDFSKFGKTGLFLITGNTGSGKTTIFDAITYALYGRASGENREKSMLRSSYADENVPTYVELKFILKGKIYCVRRNPSYERKARRGDAVVKESDDATLTLPDGSIISKTKAVTGKIEEILALSAEQFMQIAMIAQGDFQKLLVSSTEERQRIFRKIFKTEKYLLLQNNLSAVASLLKGDCAKILNSLSTSFSSSLCNEKSSYFSDYNNLMEKDFLWEEKIFLLKNIIFDSQSLYAEKEKEVNALKEKIQKSTVMFSEAQDYLECILNCEKNSLELKKLEEESKTLLEEKDSLEKEKEKIKESEKTATVIKSTLFDYDELEKVREKIIETKNSIKEIKEKLRDTEERLSKGQRVICETEDKIKDFSSAKENVLLMQAEIEKKENEEKSYLELKNLLSQKKSSEKELLENQKEYKEKTEEASILGKKYQAAYTLFLDEQAGVLAEQLKENIPCPVCGSLNHPNKAKKPEKVLLQSELEELKIDYELAMEEAAKKSRECAVLTEGIKNLATQIEKVVTSLEIENENFFEKSSFEEVADSVEQKQSATQKQATKQNSAEKQASFSRENTSLSLDEKSIEVIIENFVKEIKELEDLLEKEKEKKSLCTELEANLPKYKNRLEELLKEKNQFENSLSVSERDLENQSKNSQLLSNKLSYSSKSKALEAIEKMENEVSLYNQKIMECEEKSQKIKNEIIEKNTILKENQERIKGKNNLDAKRLESEIADLKKDEENLQESLTNIYHIISTNQSVINVMEENLKALSQKEREYSMVHLLSETANGNLGGGKDKIKLETFVQMTYFDRVIAHANTRFLTMSNGQYELVRQKDSDNAQHQTGLELNVIDHFNGGYERSVKTLSGGESFEASLSLALGFSDEIATG